MENKNNESRSFRYMLRHLYQNRFQSRQKGSLLIGLIITIVIFSILGGAMVSIFSSSAFDAVFVNYAQRAYYASESGTRYAIAIYRHTVPAMTPAQYVAYAALNLGSPITLPNNNGQAAITITDSMNGVTTNQTATSAENKNLGTGDSLSVSGTITNFPLKNGFFYIGTTLLSYKTRLGSDGTTPTNQLQWISGQGSTVTPVTTATVVTAPKNQVSITSKGSFPLAGIFNMSRTVNYGWILSGGAGGGPQPPPLLDLPSLVANNPFGSTPSLGSFVTENVGGGTAITVTQTTGGNAEAVLGFSGSGTNPFLVAWQNAGNYLSYDFQIKIATGTPSGNTFIDKPDNYIAGLTFRSKGTNPGQWQQYGLAFAKYHSDGGFQSNINPTAIYPTLSSALSPYSLGDKGWSAKISKYVKCTSTITCTVASNGNLGVGWVEYNPPMILLWTRNSNQTSGDDYWLAYKLLEDEPTAGIIDGNGLLKDWSTIMLRVVEAASIKLTATSTSVGVGDTITAGGGFNANVFKIINDNDGKIVLLLNGVGTPLSTPTGTFTAGTTALSTETSWGPGVAGYRDRDNYIWAMFGDTGNQGTANNLAIDNTRRANARVTDDSVVTTTNKNCYVHWSETNIADWGNNIVENCSTPQTVKNDYFKLVAWNTNLNTNVTNGDANMRIMGTGKDAGAILRTNKWKTVAYTSGAFPYEVGFHSLGKTATITHFDDPAINFPGQTSAGTPYFPPVQQ